MPANTQSQTSTDAYHHVVKEQEQIPNWMVQTIRYETTGKPPQNHFCVSRRHRPIDGD